MRVSIGQSLAAEPISTLSFTSGIDSNAVTGPSGTVAYMDMQSNLYTLGPSGKVGDTDAVLVGNLQSLIQSPYAAAIANKTITQTQISAMQSAFATVQNSGGTPCGPGYCGPNAPAPAGPACSALASYACLNASQLATVEAAAGITGASASASAAASSSSLSTNDFLLLGVAAVVLLLVVNQ